MCREGAEDPLDDHGMISQQLEQVNREHNSSMDLSAVPSFKGHKTQAVVITMRCNAEVHLRQLYVV